MSDCVFCKIAKGEVPCRKVFENDEIIAFHDLHPAAPVHFLIIPKKHIESLATATPADASVLGNMLSLAASLAKQESCNDGFRTIVNTGRVGGQEVYHLHMHVLGGNTPLGPIVQKAKTF